MDPSIPTQWRSKRQDLASDQQPRKKSRGRPLKSSDNSKVPEQERRAQIRRAQEAFRLRKLAATKSLEGRVESLEACIQDMSTVFVDLSDSLIRSAALQKDPATTHSLVAATSKFVTLAKDVMDDSDDVIDTALYPGSNSSYGGKATRPTVGITSLPNNRQTKSTTAPVPRLLVPEHFNPVPATLLKKEVFGNGWFGLQPEVLRRLSPPKSADLGQLDGSFGVKLLQTTLSVAYEYLMDVSGSHYDIIMNMYGFALMYHTKEELIFNLRWFLGPGFRALRALGRAVFGYSSSLSLQYLSANSSGLEPKILNPLIDALALVEAQKTYPTIQYLNAFDVEDYIISKGAFHIDQDTILLRVVDDERLNPEWSGTVASSLKSNGTPALEEMKGYLPRDAALTFSSANGLSSTGNIPIEPGILINPSSNHMDHGWIETMNFDHDAHDRHNSAYISPKTIERAMPRRNKVRTLSVPLLLQNLAQKSPVFGNGSRLSN
ncbi:hypothetical protein ONS96_012207 [Cadophora gregata f. sp. sojae]|nr:hypothetical protein ONS96_012207 [Cadophora gregata f. sp. sojae]